MISGSLHFKMDPSPSPVQARRLIEYICNVQSYCMLVHACSQQSIDKKTFDAQKVMIKLERNLWHQVFSKLHSRLYLNKTIIKLYLDVSSCQTICMFFVTFLQITLCLKGFFVRFGILFVLENSR